MQKCRTCGNTNVNGVSVVVKYVFTLKGNSTSLFLTLKSKERKTSTFLSGLNRGGYGELNTSPLLTK